MQVHSAGHIPRVVIVHLVGCVSRVCGGGYCHTVHVYQKCVISTCGGIRIGVCTLGLFIYWVGG